MPGRKSRNGRPNRPGQDEANDPTARGPEQAVLRFGLFSFLRTKRRADLSIRAPCCCRRTVALVAVATHARRIQVVRVVGASF